MDKKLVALFYVVREYTYTYFGQVYIDTQQKSTRIGVAKLFFLSGFIGHSVLKQ